MRYTSLNHITRSVLNQKQLTMHWYFQFLKLSADCLRELHFDTLRVVQTKKMPVNNYNAIDIPCDFVDYVKVGIQCGQEVTPLIQNSGINRLHNLDENGNPVKYGATNNESWWVADVITTNLIGENIGRMYGYKDGGNYESFKILPERNEIQLGETVEADYVILEYISDGTGLTDAATKVDAYAQKAIESYVMWKSGKNRDNPFSPEAEYYHQQHRVLRARKNPLTLFDVISTINRSKNSGVR